MSPRAACRLETLGFTAVYDYVPGKTDWLARGLPTEGELAATPRAHRFASRDVVTVNLQESVDAVLARIEASPYPFAIVAADDGIVLGRLPLSAVRRAAGKSAGEVMEAGPSTVRADLPAAELLERLESRDLQFAIVTTPEGQLIGVVRRDDLQRQRPGRS